MNAERGARNAEQAEFRGTFSLGRAFLQVKLETGGVKALWWRTLNLLGSAGWEIRVPDRIQRDYPILAPTYRHGIRKGLEFETTVHPWARGGLMKMEFFQNVVFENPHGGRYDFDREEKMPYLIRLRYQAVTTFLAKFWRSYGIVDDSAPSLRSLSALERVRWWMQTSGHWRGQELLEWEPREQESYNWKDRDGQRVRPGQVKYFYSHRGRLMRGRVYWSLNNMWRVVLNAREVTSVASFHLFDLAPGTPRRRSRKGGRP